MSFGKDKSFSITSVWKGVFSSFAEAGGDSDVFASETWIEAQRDKILCQLKERNIDSVADSNLSRDYPLPQVVGMLFAQKNEISVLDYGGGMGLQFLEVIRKVVSSDQVMYRIIDNSDIISQVPEQMKVYDNLLFYDAIEKVGDVKVDILHIGSTLQYIEDWRGLLKKLNNRFNPAYFVFSDLLAGNIPTFVTHQIYYDKSIPHIFINLEEFLNFMFSEFDVKLLFKSKFVRKILNQEDVFPNCGLPEAYRIDRPYNLVFKKI